MSGIAIVGGGLAGLRAAEALRAQGFDGELTVIGDEPHMPYDRPPLSKQALLGRIDPMRTTLPRLGPMDGVNWRLGVPASGLDLDAKRVELADGQTVDYDKVLLATGVRARPWPEAEAGALEGVLVVHGAEDAKALSERLAAGPGRVLVIGAGFVGSEVASVCRMLDLPVTVVDRGPSPLSGALGGVIGDVAADIQADAGVDLHCAASIESLEGDEKGRFRAALLSDGSCIDADVCVVALGAIRNTDWLRGSGLAAGPLGVGCDAGCRAIAVDALVTDDVFVAGDMARFPHVAYNYELITLEHWKNALVQSQIAAHNMICPPTKRRPHLSLPAFWSIQFEVNIKSVGVPSIADEVVITQGWPEQRRFVAAYGREGRIVAAVCLNAARWLDYYRDLIAVGAPFPPHLPGVEQATSMEPVPAAFPEPAGVSHAPTVILTGHSPFDMHAERLFKREVNP
jgi:3-phenylpropionate/trans-cinnamate dioxygenase ferredoxin reductase component